MQLNVAIALSRRNRFRRNPTRPSGSSPASHAIRGAPGITGQRRAAPATLVAIVTLTDVVPPNAGAAGVTVQVALVGTPVQVNATVPGTPAADVSSSGYTACDPAAIVAEELPFTLSAKSTPIPVNGKLCGDDPALSTTVRLPARVPAAVGINAICAVHCAPTARLAAHVLLPATIAKSPVAAML
jgi:hypothetical protein